jgi:hypothetical protein
MARPVKGKQAVDDAIKDVTRRLQELCESDKIQNNLDTDTLTELLYWAKITDAKCVKRLHIRMLQKIGGAKGAARRKENASKKK